MRSSAVITARALKADPLIVARATKDRAFDRIVRAGADRVVNPYQLGGFRLAHLVVKPTIVNFFDASPGSGDLQLDQSSLRSSSPVVGRTLAEADFRRHWGPSVVAIQRKGEVVSNPESDFQLQTGDVVVVFGSSAQIAQFEEECGGG